MSHPCPKCEAKAKCVNSRKVLDGTVQRRFNCPGCGCRFSSVEVIVSVDGELTAPKLNGHPVSNSNRLMQAIAQDPPAASVFDDLLEIIVQRAAAARAR